MCKNKVLLFVAFASCLLLACSAKAQQLLKNPDFKSLNSRGIPSQWLFYAWGAKRDLHTLAVAKAVNGFFLSQKGFVNGGTRFFQRVKLLEREKYQAEITLKLTGKPKILVRFLSGGKEFNKSIYPGSQAGWQTIKVELMAPKSGIGDFAIDMYQDGKLWLKKVTLVKKQTEKIKNEVPTGKLIKQGSFEISPTLWLPRKITKMLVPQGYKSKYALKMNGSFSHAEYCYVPIYPNRKYRFSLYARSVSGKKGKLSIGIKSAYQGDKNKYFGKAKSFILSNQWKRYEIESDFPKFLGQKIIPYLDASGDVLVDQVELCDAKTELAKGTEASVSSAGQVGNVFKYGIKYPFVFKFYDLRKKKSVETFLVKIENFRGKAIWEKYLEINFNDAGFAELTKLIVFKNYGPGRILIYKDKELLAECVIGVVRQSLATSNRIGVHVRTCLRNSKTNKIVRFLEDELIVIQKMGLNSSARLMDQCNITSWRLVQPQADRFVFDDKELNIYKKYGFKEFLGNFTRAPSWAVKVPEHLKGKIAKYQYCPPADFDKFEDFVYQTVAHYTPVIKYWEVWNEPYGHFWYGTVEELVELHKRAYRAIKKANPDAIVVGGCISPGNRYFTESFFKAGGLKYMDVLSLHYYIGYENLNDRNNVRENIDFIKARMKFYNKGKELPLWNTESGLLSKGFNKFFKNGMFGKYSQLKEAADCADAMRLSTLGLLDNFSFGIKRYYYYFTAERYSYFSLWNNWNLFGPGIIPRPTAFALRTFMDIVGNAQFKRRRVINGMEFFEFENKSGQIILVWDSAAKKAGEEKINIPGNCRIYDVAGNDINKDSAIKFNGEVYYAVGTADSISKLSKQLTVIAKNKLRKDKDNFALRDFSLLSSLQKKSIKQLNIKSLCNMGFKDRTALDSMGGWTDEGSNNDLRKIKTGLRKLWGLPFQVICPENNNGKSVITLRSKSTGQALPLQLTIPFNDEADVIYFLHAAGNVAKKGASYIINYRDGTTATIPFLRNYNVQDWWHRPHYLKNYKAVSVPLGLGIKRYIYVFQWKNPFPKKQVASITFKSDNGRTTPVLLAITYGDLAY